MGKDFCAVYGCSHERGRRGDCLSFFSFPTEEPFRSSWIRATRRAGVKPGSLWVPKKSSKICSCHFSTPPIASKRFKGFKSMIPDINLPLSTIKIPRPTPRPRKVLAPIVKSSSTPTPCTDTCSINSGDSECEINSTEQSQINCMALGNDHDYLKTVRGGRVSDAVDKLVEQIPEVKYLLNEYKNLLPDQNADEIKLKKQVMRLDNIRDDKKLFNYYTGFAEISVFDSLFEYLEPMSSDMKYIYKPESEHFVNKNIKHKPGNKRLLSGKEEFFLTLARLKLGIPLQDLAVRYGISISTVSVIFNTWVALLSHSLEALCSMPSHEKSQENSAKCFNPFKSVQIVIDCTELFSETPSSLAAHKQIFSPYKHHSTFKFLVGISPSGAVTYISDMFGGRASDKLITQTSTDFLDGLLPGTSVMADRGFTISGDLPPGVDLIIPPFKNKDRSQFSKAMVLKSKEISEARVHVERAIRRIKQFELLSQECKLAMADSYCMIFKACAYLVNFQKPFLVD